MLSKKLKELRKEKNVTQEELANIIGVERSSIGKYEGSSKIIPSNETLHQIAEYFGVSLDYLMVDELPRAKILKKLQRTLNLTEKELQLIDSHVTDEFFMENPNHAGSAMINGLLYHRSIYLWCKYCQCWHHHGFPDKTWGASHYRAHCQTDTPYKISTTRGYTVNPILDLDEVLGEFPTHFDIEEYPIMTKYRKLDKSGQEFIDMMIDREYQRCVQSQSSKETHLPDMKKIMTETGQVAQALKNQKLPTKK